MKKVIVGFDPGVAAWGLCVLDKEDGSALDVHFYKDGKIPFPEKQKESFKALRKVWRDVVRKYDVKAIAIEEMPVGRGIASVQQSIGMFLGIIFMETITYKMYRYTPATWKKEVTGKGNRKKTECRGFIQRRSGWKHKQGEVSNDAYDAIGVALCHWYKKCGGLF